MVELYPVEATGRTFNLPDLDVTTWRSPTYTCGCSEQSGPLTESSRRVYCSVCNVFWIKPLEKM